MQFIGFAYFHQIARKVLLYLGNYSLEKSITENQADDILTVHTQFVICTRFTALLTFYIKKCTRFQSIRRAKFFRVSYYSRGRMTFRRHKKKTDAGKGLYIAQVTKTPFG